MKRRGELEIPWKRGNFTIVIKTKTPMIKFTLLSQITGLLPRLLIHVNRYLSDKYSKGIDSRTQLISMLFCQLGHAESAGDISNALRSITGNIHHPGCSKALSKSTVPSVNARMSYKVFQEYYYSLAREMSIH